MEIKIATTGKAILIEALASEIWTQHYTPILGAEQVEYMLDKFCSKSAIEADVNRGFVYYIAYYDDTPCGYSAVKHSDASVFLSKLYVKRTHRGKGIGKAMLDAIYAYAQDRRAARIWLTCNKNNKNTLSVYQKLGFRIVDEVVKDIGGGFVMDDYVLEKMLIESHRR